MQNKDLEKHTVLHVPYFTLFKKAIISHYLRPSHSTFQLHYIKTKDTQA